MHDWVWKTHEAVVRASFTFVDKNGTKLVHDSASFANALEQQCEDFGRVRGVANAARHFSTFAKTASGPERMHRAVRPTLLSKPLRLEKATMAAGLMAALRASCSIIWTLGCDQRGLRVVERTSRYSRLVRHEVTRGGASSRAVSIARVMLAEVRGEVRALYYR